MTPESVGLMVIPAITENSSRLLARPMAAGGVASTTTVRLAILIMLPPTPMSIWAPTSQ
jgi:hypothetical protein